MNRQWRISGTVLLMAFMLLAADDAPAPPAVHSAAGKLAMSKHDAAIRKAEEAYWRAMDEADKQFILDLDIAIRRAMDSKDLDEAVALNVQKKQAQEKVVGGQGNGVLLGWLGGTTWQHQFGPTVTYRSDGTITGSNWAGGIGHWQAVDSNTIFHIEPGSGHKIKITFAADHHAAIWEYPPPGNEVYHSVRVNQ